MGAPKKTQAQRFWPHVRRGADDECWEWIGHIDSRGYGIGWTGTRCVGAHRISHELLVGPIPAGLVIDHLCRNRACVNPRHLEPVTIVENLRRGIGPNSRKAVAARTHCPRGHEYTPDNLTFRANRSWRECLTCARAAAKANYTPVGETRRPMRPRLTSEQKRDVLRLLSEGVRHAELAVRFNTSGSTISNINTGKNKP